jgi:hypothetical protein
MLMCIYTCCAAALLQHTYEVLAKSSCQEQVLCNLH